jgi:hypothetical protein
MTTPNFKELALEGKFLLLDVKQAESAEHNRRSGHIAATRPAPTAPAATLASFNVFDHRDGHVIGQVKSNGGRYVAHDAADQTLGSFRTAHEAMRAVEQSATDAVWASVIAEQNLGAGHAPRPTPQMDPNHGWSSIISQVEREQTQSNLAVSASGQQSENHGWGDVLKRVAKGA